MSVAWGPSVPTGERANCVEMPVSVSHSFVMKTFTFDDKKFQMC